MFTVTVWDASTASPVAVSSVSLAFLISIIQMLPLILLFLLLLKPYMERILLPVHIIAIVTSSALLLVFWLFLLSFVFGTAVSISHITFIISTVSYASITFLDFAVCDDFS